MMSSSRILPAFAVLLLAVPLASCGNRDLNAPELPRSAKTPSVSTAAATDSTITARGISTLGSGN
jgi:hypothetical protein